MRPLQVLVVIATIIAIAMMGCGRDEDQVQNLSNSISGPQSQGAQKLPSWGTPQSSGGKGVRSLDWENKVTLCGTVFINRKDCINRPYWGGDVGIPNVTVTLHGDNLDLTTVTGPGGSYCFVEVPAPPPEGTPYTICIDVNTLPADVSHDVYPAFGNGISNCQTGLVFGSTGGLDFGVCGPTPPPPPPPPEETPCPAGSFTFTMLANGDLSIRYDQFPAPNDNSYGLNIVGWGTHAHRFSDLVNSDHAGFQLVDPNGTTRLAFNIDYLTVKAGTPSGYGSLGPFGGDGKVITGTLTPADIEFTTSLAKNLNETGFCVSGNCSGGGTNLLVNSPPTVSNTSYALPPGSPYGAWDFHNTYFVVIKAAKLASLGFNSSWSVEPAADQLHNSPAKECPPASGGPCNLDVTATSVKDKEVTITIKNNGASDVFLTDLSLSWPSATNGFLNKVKRDGDTIYDTPDIAGGSATLTVAQLVADPNKRKYKAGESHKLVLVFQNNANPTFSNYGGLAGFGPNCQLVVLP